MDGKNFAKEEMSPNIWLFFQKIKLDKNNLNIISVDDEKSIREWQIDLVSGKATLTPMFDPSSNWLCLNTEKQLTALNDLYKSGALSGYEFEKAKKKLGWEAKISLEEMIAEMVQEDEKIISSLKT